MKRNISLALALCVATFAFSACKNKQDSASTTTTTTVTSTTSGTAAPAAPAAAPAGNSVGVPECDDYISKYEACINSKVPEMARGALKDAFDRTRTEWKAAAATPEGKQGLAIACKAASDAAKQAVAAYGCTM